ncbi:G5 domain-containing protein [Trueperella pecoris]|nr:G5 domain-containing protein [Trueperella pecoris]
MTGDVLTDHSSSRGSAFDPHLLDVPPKPGSRRARRMAERAAQSADTAEIASIKRVVTSGGQPYAEHMNFNLVTSRATGVAVSKPRRYSKVLQAAGAASIAVLAAGGTVFPSIADVPRAERAVAAVVDTAPSATTSASSVSFDLTVDGKTVKIDAKSGDTYAAALVNAGISIASRDEVSVSLADVVTTAPVTIVRVVNKVVTEESATPFETERVETDTLPKGEEKVATAGVEGKSIRNYQVTYRDGAETSRALVLEAVESEPVKEVIHVGTRDANTAPAAGTPAPAGAPVPPGSAREIAQGMVAARGWGGDQWACLDALWQRESGWNSQAMNRSSGAYGIPQALPGSKMASAGADWQTNPATQISWGLGYIAGRYGTPCGAWNHSQARGWY